MLAAIFVVVLVVSQVAMREKIPVHGRSPVTARIASVDGVDATVLERCSAELERLAFVPLLEFELPHQQSKFVRMYFHTFVSPERCCVGAAVIRLQNGGCIIYPEFTTWFADGGQVVTTASPGPFVHIDPDVTNIDRSGESASRLLALHSQQVQTFVASGRRVVEIDSVDTLGELVVRTHEREVAHALSKGLVRREGDDVVRTFKLERDAFAATLGPIVPGRSLRWHAGLIAVVVMSSVAAALGSPLLVGFGLGMFLVSVAGVRSIVWLFVAALLARLLRGPPFVIDNFVFGAFFGWTAFAIARIAGRRIGVSRVAPLIPRGSSIVLGALAASAIALATVLSVLRVEVHVLPALYKGPVVVVYGDPAGQPGSRRHLSLEYRVPDSGVLRVQTPSDESRRVAVYVDQDGLWELSRLPLSNPYSIGICHFGLRDGAKGQMFAAYFIGNERTCREARPLIDARIAQAVGQES